MSDAEVVEAAVGAVLHAGGLLLLRRRPDDRSFPGAWCCPGGRLDPAEPPAVAVRREVAEETGLITELIDFIGTFDSPWPARQRIYRLHCFRLVAPSRAVVLSDEHTEARWLTPGDPIPAPLAGPVTAWLIDRVR